MRRGTQRRGPWPRSAAKTCARDGPKATATSVPSGVGRNWPPARIEGGGCRPVTLQDKAAPVTVPTTSGRRVSCSRRVARESQNCQGMAPSVCAVCHRRSAHSSAERGLNTSCHVTANGRKRRILPRNPGALSLVAALIVSLTLGSHLHRHAAGGGQSRHRARPPMHHGGIDSMVAGVLGMKAPPTRYGPTAS